MDSHLSEVAKDLPMPGMADIFYHYCAHLNTPSK